MIPCLTDDQLRARIATAINAGQAMTDLGFRLRAERVRFSDTRLRRLWREMGGPVRAYTRTYAAGVGPKDRGGWR